MPYSVAAVRGKNFGSPAIPWYLSGGIPASNCVQALMFKGAASGSAAVLDQSGSGNNPTVVGSPTWSSSTGLGGFSTSDYLNTLIVPGSTYSAVCGWLNASSHEKNPFGVQQTSPSRFFYFNPTFISSSTYYYWGQASNSPGGQTTSGTMAMVGLSTKVRAFLNGVLGSDYNSTWNTMTQPIFIGCRNNDGTPGQAFGGTITGFALYNTSLTDAQAIAVSNAIAGF